MYIARTGQLIDNGKELEQKFYILDEDKDYALVRGVSLTFPQETSQDEIDIQITQILKDEYENVEQKPSPYSLEDIKKGAVQKFSNEVIKIQDKLDGPVPETD